MISPKKKQQIFYDLNSELGLKKYKVFKENWKFIQEHNIKYPKTVLGLTPFVDMTWEEFKEGYVNYDVDMTKFNEDLDKNLSFDEMADIIDDEEDVISNTNKNQKKMTYKPKLSPDWSPYFLETPHQGMTCHSCWAFAAAANAESVLIINGWENINIDLSEILLRIIF